jgi:hypothetical protein
MLSVVMLNIIMLNIANNPLIPSVIMLNVVMLCVVAQSQGDQKIGRKFAQILEKIVQILAKPKILTMCT